MKGEKHTGKRCHSCGEELTSWDLRCSKALAYKNPNCESCIAKEYDITVEKASQAYLQCRCSHCGNIVFDALSRDEFDCPKCGHKDKFDFNTCRNLTVPNIDNVIKHQIKSQIEEKKAYEKQTEKTAEKYQEIEAKEEARKLDNL